VSGKIVRVGELAPDAGVDKVVDREALQAHEVAREVLAAADRRAEELVAAARAEAEALRAAAREEGRAAGLAEWESRLAELAGAQARLQDEARPQLVALALRVAEKILRRRLDMQPDAVLPMVEEALAAARGHGGGAIVLRAHPDDAAALNDLRARLRLQGPRWESVEVVADAEMRRGGCRVETGYGTIDASVETQLRAIEQLLLHGGGG
jgi:type III secretion system HrpE/YscL family protein